MTTDRDVSRLLDRWLADGINEVNDHVLDLVEGRIARERQRPAWGIGRSDPSMTRTLTFVGGLAAAVLVAVVGFNLLRGQPGPGVPSSPPATPTAAPTPSLTSTKTTTIRPFAGSPNRTVTYELPGGWGTFDDWAVGPDGAGVVVVLAEVDGIHGDPCRWDSAGTRDETQPGDLAAGGDALAVTTALHTNTAYTSAGAPKPVSVGSNDGYEVEIRLPADLDTTGCDAPGSDASGQYLVFGGRAGGFFPQGPDNRWQVSIIDAEDGQLAVILSSFESTSAADMAAARSVVDSIQFGQ